MRIKIQESKKMSLSQFMQTIVDNRKLNTIDWFIKGIDQLGDEIHLSINHTTLLHYICKYLLYHENMVKALRYLIHVKEFTNFFVIDPSGHSALYYAIKSDQINAVIFLLKECKNLGLNIFKEDVRLIAARNFWNDPAIYDLYMEVTKE